MEKCIKCVQRDYCREGRPLLTEVNRDSKRTNDRGPFLIGSLGLSCRYKRFLFCLGCTSRPSTKYFSSSPYTISMPLSTLPQQAGQAAMLGRLSLSVCLWMRRSGQKRRHTLFFPRWRHSCRHRGWPLRLPADPEYPAKTHQENNM